MEYVSLLKIVFFISIIKKIITLAAYVTGNFVENPKIYGTCTNYKDVEILNKLDIQIMENGFINGMNAIIIGLGNIFGFEGICLLGETSGYILDSSAAHNILDKLKEICSLSLNLKNMQEKVSETIILMRNIQQQMIIDKNKELELKKEKESRYRYIS